MRYLAFSFGFSLVYFLVVVGVLFLVKWLELFYTIEAFIFLIGIGFLPLFLSIIFAQFIIRFFRRKGWVFLYLPLLTVALSIGIFYLLAVFYPPL